MELKKAIEILKSHNEWRRGADMPMTDPKVIGEAIDTVIEGYKGNRMEIPSNPWHKASEELPTRFGDYLVVIKSQQFGRRYALKCWYGYPKDPFGDNPSKEWVLEDDEIVTHWMPIPEIKED